MNQGRPSYGLVETEPSTGEGPTRGRFTALMDWHRGSPGERTQRGVVAVSYLLIVGMIVCSVVLAQSVPDESDATGAGVGLTALGLFGAAAAVGAMIGFLFGLP